MQYVLIIVLVLSSFGINAQNYSKFSFRGELYPNLSIPLSLFKAIKNSKPDINFGLLIEYKASENINLNTGIKYTTTGIKSTVNLFDINGTSLGKSVTKEINTLLSVPFLFQYNTNGLFIEFGPNVSYLIGYKLLNDGIVVSSGIPTKTKLIVGGLFAMGYEVNITESVLFKTNLYTKLIQLQYRPLNVGVGIGLRYKFKSN